MQNWQLLEEKLKNLEKTALNKIKQSQNPEKIIELENQILQQQKTINELTHELKTTQKLMLDTKKENDFLSDKNRLFADKMFKFKSQGSKLITKIEEDMQKIKETIKNKL